MFYDLSTMRDHFRLPCKQYSKIFSDVELDEQIVIVSMFGKSCVPSDYSSFMFETRIFRDESVDARNDSCTIECNYAKNEKVLYLNLIGPYNAQHLDIYFENSLEEIEKKGFLFFWNNVKNDYGRCLLFLFSLSHIVIYCHPSSGPDYNMIQLLKTLSFVRPKYQTFLTNLLNETSTLNYDWVYHGRLCSPRLLFIFKCPISILNEDDDRDKTQRMTKFAHSIEDQIYFTLRKCRVVKNVCNRAFFSIAANDEFVFIRDSANTCENLANDHFERLIDKLEAIGYDKECDQGVFEVKDHAELNFKGYSPDETGLDKMWCRKPGRPKQLFCPTPDNTSQKSLTSQGCSPQNKSFSPNEIDIAQASFTENVEENPQDSGLENLENRSNLEESDQDAGIYSIPHQTLFSEYLEWSSGICAPETTSFFDPYIMAASSYEEHYLRGYGENPEIVCYPFDAQGNHLKVPDPSHDLWCIRDLNEEQPVYGEGYSFLNCGLAPGSLQITDVCDHQSLSSSSSSSSSSSESYGMDEFNDQCCNKLGEEFRTFLNKHIRKAQNGGFNDNIGKYANVKPFFELPHLRAWMVAANTIMENRCIGLKVEPTAKKIPVFGTELQFSSSRCKKIIPLAVAHYQENLPLHYNLAIHQKQVKRAVDIFNYHARGPEKYNYILQLKEECEKIWKSGRQTCEVLSLFKHSCTRPSHQCSLLDADLDHWNAIQYVSSCNCGMKQGNRQDPFTLKAANYLFYRDIGKDCGCNLLDFIMFPVFQPSTHDYKAADLQSYAYRNDHSNSASHTPGKLWTPDNCTINGDTPTSPPLFDNANSLAFGFYSPNQDKQLVKQASTTEYLPSMVHFDSPSGLLPQFPSWSLVCRGSSSLYSHNLGLHDQPGFILGSNYLLPWDVTIREKDQASRNSSETVKKIQKSGFVSRGNFKKYQRHQKDVINVKIFLGVEYECLKGHRFISSGPGKILKVSANGLVKENANKIAKGNMPLYLPCPCGKAPAQLLRIHIVTPKAPVFVTIDPKVRAAPAPCPVFITGESKTIALSQSAYWVLRLPFVYASERNVYSAPTRLKKKFGELIGPTYGITQIHE